MPQITFDPNTLAKSAEVNSNFEGTWNGTLIADEAIKKRHLDPTEARINVRVYSATTASTLIPTVDDYDMFVITALAGNITIANPTGVPVDGQGILIRIRDDGTSRTLTFGTYYRGVGITLPTATLTNRVLYISCRFNSQDTKWDVLAIGKLL